MAVAQLKDKRERLSAPAQSSQEALLLFKKYCVQKGMRYTPERELIIREIYRTPGHFDIDHLFLKLRTHHPQSRIAKTSIYRSVPFLLDSGILRESIAEAGRVVYEHTIGRFDHDHFRCIKCGKVLEFYSPELDTAQKKICEQENFQILWRTNVINGYCAECSNATKPGS